MIRRTLLASLALVLAAGLGSSAFAESATDNDGRHTLCIMGNDSGRQEGVCVWIPTR